MSAHTARPAGGGGLALLDRFNVALIGTIDGANTTFTTPDDFDPNTFRLYYNGQRLEEGAGNDFTTSESGGVGTGFDTVTMSFAPKAIGQLDKLIADYRSS